MSSTSIESADYSASEISDGERAVFYILGQVLSANEGSILIFDEPELHIHKSIISNLWDEIEKLRPDCSFLMITHDIEFAATRVAKKYVIRNYYSAPAWDISEIHLLILELIKADTSEISLSFISSLFFVSDKSILFR